MALTWRLTRHGVFFQKTGAVPLAPIDGGVAASLLVMNQHAAPSSSLVPASPAHCAPLSSAYRTTRVGLPAHPVSQAATSIPATFYIVHVGYSPGVYNSL